MKHTLLISLFLSLSISAFSQKIKFTDSTNVWKWYNISCCPTGTSIPTHSVGTLGYSPGTAIVGGQTYLRYGGSYIREDTTLHIVYIRVHSTLDSIDRILYNYNWQIGDTVRQPPYYGYHPVCWITGIDSTMINSNWYKVWHFQGSYFGTMTDLNYHIIEGLGCTNGIEFPIIPYPQFEVSDQLICFSNHGSTYSLSNPIPSWGLAGDIYLNNTTSCLLHPVGINEDLSSIHKIVVAPNPIDQTTKILFPHLLTSGTATIINSVGQVVSKIPFENKEDIAIGDKIKAPGIYYYRVTDNISGENFSGKFINQ